ncbi:MAG: alpha/beta hydrolase [Planctomycetota bacterium]
MPLPIDKTFGQDFGGELCPQASAIVQALADPNAPPAAQTDIEAARRGHALADYDIPVASAETRVEERWLPTRSRPVRVRLYTPPGDGPFPVLVFAHGGCWTFCSLDSHDRLCRYYSHHARCVVVSVDYGLAPEQPFPRGLNGFYDSLLWCFGHADEIRGDATRVAVAGDSAGGNLCAVAAQRLQAHPNFRLCLQLLIYPICDAANLRGGSVDRYANGYFFTREVLAWTASIYSRDSGPQHPEISPLSGEVGPRMAPALFIVAQCDILCDQALDYARKLREAGVDVQSHFYRGVPHAFVAMAGALELGQQALAYSAEHLTRAFYNESDS